MKSSTLTNTGAAGLNPYQWVGFSYQLGLSWGPIQPPVFTPSLIQVLAAADGSGKYPNFIYRFNPPGAVPIIPAWIQPGVGLLIKASVTVAGTSYDISGAYVVRAIDPSGSGSYFDVDAPSPSGVRDAVAFTQAWVNPIGLDNGSGKVTTATITLVVQAQAALVYMANGAGTIAPVVSPNGDIPYQFSMSDGMQPTLIEAPVGGKFDLADWQAVGTAGAPATIYVAFI